MCSGLGGFCGVARRGVRKDCGGVEIVSVTVTESVWPEERVPTGGKDVVFVDAHFGSGVVLMENGGFGFARKSVVRRIHCVDGMFCLVVIPLCCMHTRL